MAFVYITEFAKLAREDLGGPNGIVQTPVEPPLAEQVVAIGASSVASSALHRDTRVVRVHTDAICHIAVAESPSASAGGRRLAANQTEYIGIPNTGSYKIAVITGS